MLRHRPLRSWVILHILSHLALLTSARAPPISIDGSHFFYPNGSQFFIRGVAYQDGGARAIRSNVAKPIIDPLNDGSKCARDIPHLIKLGVNVVRIYALDSSADHSACMQSLDDVNIYVLADLGDGVEDIFGSQSTAWTHTIYSRFKGLVDSFHNYNNLLGFVIASEVVTDRNRTAAMPFVKAAVRDMKAYINTKGYRNIPIGYTGSDDVKVSKIPAYMVCTDIWNTPEIDFYGLSLYTWCGDSNLEASGYQHQIQDFRSYPKPVIISEYGCNTPSPRGFSEVRAIYGDKGMTDVFSGGIAYQYYNDSYNYGLVNIFGNRVKENPDFSSLSSQLAAATPSSTPIGKWPPTTIYQTPCPTLDQTWFAGTVLPPIPSESICGCMLQSLKCVGSSNFTNQIISDSLEALCGEDEPKPECLGASGNGTTDKYGAYSTCSLAERHSWVLNQLFLSRITKESNTEEVCRSLHGTIQTLKAPETASDGCQIVLRQAGPRGTGTITSTPANLPTAIKTATSTVAPKPNPQPFSGGAKAGIIIAAILFLSILVALGALRYNRWRRKKEEEKEEKEKKKREDETKVNSVPEMAKSGLADGRVPSVYKDRHFLDGHSIVEADSKAVVFAELSDTAMCELPGDPGVTQFSADKKSEMG